MITLSNPRYLPSVSSWKAFQSSGLNENQTRIGNDGDCNFWSSADKIVSNSQNIISMPSFVTTHAYL